LKAFAKAMGFHFHAHCGFARFDKCSIPLA
jgi:hypothetical protein